VLREVAEGNREDVYRLLQCLVVSIRPLRVEELAEVLAINFDGVEGIPKLNPDWRWEDQEEALQAACSSLIAIVDTGRSRVVQFSHFSVKEFLASPRLADSSTDVSRYHISLEPAHTILAQSSLCVLLRLPVGDHVHDEDGFPLAGYAARHWIDHARFGNVSSHIWKGMEQLFDPVKPQFSTWLRLYDIDTDPNPDSVLWEFTPLFDEKPVAPPLYYAARCGLHDLAEHLIVNCLQDVNAHGGHYVTPLVAALAGKHFRLAELLYQQGAALDARGFAGKTPLHAISSLGDREMLQWLISHGADMNVRQKGNDATPLHWAASGGQLEEARILLQNNADPEAQDSDGDIPLHTASRRGRSNVARLLLGSGVDVNARNKDGWTPLHRASSKLEYRETRQGRLAVARLLLEHGADIGAKDNEGRTAFQVADEEDFEQMKKLLSEHIATEIPL
jgi:ankyrin repeat protein